MRTIILISIIIISSLAYGQKDDCDTKQEILEKIFNDYNQTSYGDGSVFETKVWEKHATISLTSCHIIYLSEGITALAFNIYLADDPNEYRYMIEEGIENMIDVDETTSFQGGGQRLIQVIFYDTKNDKFLGKGKGFPLKGFTWIPEGMGDVTELNTIEDFEAVISSDNTCILTILECPDCLGGLKYVFKYHNGEILTSAGIDECYESIYETGDGLIMKLITNCYEYQIDDAPKQYREELLFKF